MRISQFRERTSVELRKNKEFMMKAVSLYCVLFFAADDSLRRDKDLAIVAYSSKQNLIAFQYDNDHEGDIEEYNEGIEFLKSVRETARSKVNNHKGFMKGFLPGMSANAGKDCHLSMLVQGPETTLAFKKLIAEFLGFPRVQESMKQHRRAVENLSRIPQPIRTGCSYDCMYCAMY
jgi:hypothetical protein